MTTIYGLREKGASEFRYIGRTEYRLEQRLKKHVQNAARQYPSLISAWINAANEIEIVPIVDCPTDIACAEERRIVELYHSQGHRLTNSHLRPHIIARARAA